MIEIREESGENLNLNISAYRVLYILLLFVQHKKLTLLELTNLLSRNPLINKAYSSETLIKYINTLREVGCRIERVKNQRPCAYELVKNPFPMHLSEEDLRSANRLLMLVAAQPDEDLHIQYHKFLQKVGWALREDQEERLLYESDTLTAPVEVQRRRALLRDYKKYCRDGLVMEIDYQPEEESTLRLAVEPQRAIQEGRKVYLLGIDKESRHKLRLNLERIVAIKQLPSKVQHSAKQTLVVFELSGRLAKTYRPYPGETVMTQTRERLRVKAKCDDYPALILRLMKYGHFCEVISPGYVRNEIRQKIQELLNNCEKADAPAASEAN